VAPPPPAKKRGRRRRWVVATTGGPGARVAVGGADTDLESAKPVPFQG
jgi:hypothetical protein